MTAPDGQVPGERTLEPAAEEAPSAREYADDALALRLANEVADGARWVEEWHRWMLWDGKRWIEDKKLEMLSRARDIARAAAAEIEQSKCAAAIRSRKTIAAIEGLAKSDRRLAAVSDQWDADHWLLNTPIGIVDLKTGKIHSHSSRRFMTKMTAVGPDGDCPTWMAFLDRITGGDESLIEFIQRMCGYCLTGDTSEHALFFLFGHGANGKSVLLNTISGILGDYAWTTAIETFTATNTESHPTGLAALRGARLVPLHRGFDGLGFSGGLEGPLV